ncbi:MAG: choice-of-anchor J domain-containing protein, partial [Candidatus Coatesbacteria bacterium]
MKRIYTAFFAAFFLLLSATAVSADKWTLMIYLDADSNLHDAGIDDINEMEWCSDNSEVNIIVLFDGAVYGDSVIYEIQHDPNGYQSPIISPTVDDGGAVIPTDSHECDMSDWHTFDDFVDWTIANYPADNYLICLWDHGDGIFREGEDVDTGLFKGFCGGMKLWEIDNVLEDTAAQIGHDIGVVGFDVCLLGQIETGYQLKDSTSYVIASEETEPFDGWDYFAFEIVRDDPNTSARDLAAEIVDEYLNTTGGNPYAGDTQAAQDMIYFDTDLATYFDNLCSELFVSCYEYKADITSARNGAWNSSYNPDCKDLYEFADNIADDGDLPESLRTAAGEFCTAWETFIVAGGVDNPSDDHGGATIYFPTNASGDGDWNSYINNITFTETQWDEFLEMYADPYFPYANYFDFENYTADDSDGDGDGVPEPGEQVDITVTVRNDGYEDATGVSGTISTTGDVTIDVGTADFGTIPADGGTGQGTFTVTINGSCPDPSFIPFDLAMHSGSLRWDQDLEFTFTCGWGLVDDVEGDTESIWTHSGDNDMWHVEDYRSHTPSHSWKCGGEDDSDYGNNMNAKLTSPAVYVPNEAPELSFWTCYWVQGGGNDNCYVEVSIDGDDWNSVGTFYGTVDEWTKRTYYLSDYAGQKVYVRFRFDTNGSVTNEGWYIDDISVAEGDTTDAGGLVVYDFVANPKDDGLL